MHPSTHIVDAEMLRKLSGKHSAAAVRRWANSQGIPVLEGADGPFTTLEAFNYRMGVLAANEALYRAEDIA